MRGERAAVGSISTRACGACQQRALILCALIKASVLACVDGSFEFRLVPAVDEITMEAVAGRIAIREDQRLLALSVQLIKLVDALVEVVVLDVEMGQFVRVSARAGTEVLSASCGICDVIDMVRRIGPHAIPAHREADLGPHSLGALRGGDILRLLQIRTCTCPGDSLRLIGGSFRSTERIASDHAESGWEGVYFLVVIDWSTFIVDSRVFVLGGDEGSILGLPVDCRSPVD